MRINQKQVICASAFLLISAIIIFIIASNESKFTSNNSNSQLDTNVSMANPVQEAELVLADEPENYPSANPIQGPESNKSDSNYLESDGKYLFMDEYKSDYYILQYQVDRFSPTEYIVNGNSIKPGVNILYYEDYANFVSKISTDVKYDVINSYYVTYTNANETSGIKDIRLCDVEYDENGAMLIYLYEEFDPSINSQMAYTLVIPTFNEVSDVKIINVERP